MGESLSTHEDYMRMALALAKRGEGNVSPNPMVGCVVVKDNRVVAEGYHERYGGYHAERNALLHCQEDVQGAVLYVTLEPCCHYGDYLREKDSKSLCRLSGFQPQGGGERRADFAGAWRSGRDRNFGRRMPEIK